MDLDPRLSYRQLIHASRGVQRKNTLAFRIHTTRGSGPLLDVEAKERNIYKEAGHYSAGTWNLKESPPCNAEDNISVGLGVIEAWFGGYRGSPGLGFNDDESGA